MAAETRRIGDNSGTAPRIRVTVRLFNSLTRFAAGPQGTCDLELPAGARVGDVIRRLGLSRERVFLVLVNGRDVTRGLDAPINEHRELDDGDVVAFSGPVPYSWGYGAPVV